MITSAILKVASRCNINCTYCYMYNLADSSYRHQPKVMSDETVSQFFSWLPEYLNLTSCSRFTVILHGGEPLLAGERKIRHIAQCRDEAARASGTRIDITMQTNGLLLTEAWISTLFELNIGFGISLDGPACYHDRHRLTRVGKGTHGPVEAKVKWILDHPVGRDLLGGVLCVVHPSMDGEHLIAYFNELGVKNLDLILPDQNYVHGSDHYPRPAEEPAYGKVLAQAYRSWRMKDPPPLQVRRFTEMIRVALGGKSRLDSVGMTAASIITLETSGEVEPVDTLKVCGDSFTKTGISVRELQGRNVETIPLVDFALRESQTLPRACRACSLRSACGGGYLPNRYGPQGFDNPTVYCNDMIYLWTVVLDDVRSNFRHLELASAL
jgi:uncharacterized protein